MDYSAQEFLVDRAERFAAAAESDFPAQIEKLSEATLACLLRGGKILVFGNGGSAALATHFSGELVGRFLQDRRSLPAISLASDASAMTAIANDYDYSEVFARQIEGHGAPGDMALGLTTSGKSPNVVTALMRASAAGIIAAVLSGQDGGPAASAADLAVIVPSSDTDFIQEAHEAALHYLCHRVDAAICQDSGT